MDLNIAMVLGVIPAILVLVAVLLMRHANNPETAPYRTLIFLVGITLVILILLVGFQWMPESIRNQAFWLGSFTIPVLAVLVVLTLVNLPALRKVTRKERWLVIGPGLVNLGLLAYIIKAPETLMYILPPIVILVAAGWLMNRKTSIWIWLLALISILLMILINDPRFDRLDWIPVQLTFIAAILMLSFPVLSACASGLLLYRGVRLVFTSEAVNRKARWVGMIHFGAGIAILAYFLYTTAWMSLWDNTRDGMAGLMILMLGIPSAIVFGMLMIYRFEGWRRSAGVAFAVIVPILTLVAFNMGWQLSFQDMTDQRAAQISQALEHYRQREGVYPPTLNALFPRDLLVIPEPLIFRGENWCYRASADAYRLAAFYRQYWGLPVSLRVYASSGTFTGALPCEDRLADMKKRYDTLPGSLSGPGQTRPEPQPVGQGQPLPYTGELQPLITVSTEILPGRWSPDSRWWFFRTVTNGAQTAALHFYNASTGQFCPESPEMAYSVYDDLPPAWLPEDRLLVQDSRHQLYQVEPCSSAGVPMNIPEDLSIGQMKAVDPASGKILLQNEAGYWLNLPDQDHPVRIPGIPVDIYASQKDNVAWSPTGKRLAIAHLDSGDSKGSVTFYLVDGDTGQVLSEQSIFNATGLGAPWIDWVSDDELLLQGSPGWLLMDLRTFPPTETDVMRDLFHLDLQIPDQISSSTNLTALDGSHYYLAVRANHPRNQNIYVYNSENGQVSVFAPTTQAILVFPDGQYQELTSLGPLPAVDTFEFFQVDSGQPGPITISVGGHQPRNYSQLGVAYFPDASRLLVISSRGVSDISLPSGNLLDYWQVGSGNDIDPYFDVSPDKHTLLAVVNWEGIYQVPVDR